VETLLIGRQDATVPFSRGGIRPTIQQRRSARTSVAPVRLNRELLEVVTGVQGPKSFASSVVS
jgi:hypothetical protein